MSSKFILLFIFTLFDIYKTNNKFSKGDSGGPLVKLDPLTNQYWQVGVVRSLIFINSVKIVKKN